jgi:hypothetical protein
MRQQQTFIAALLTGTPALAFASARYDAEGRVDGVLPAKREAGSVEDFEILAPWLRRQNVQGEAIWCRPAPEAHPWLFLDDLNPSKARGIAAKYAAVVVQTSPNNAQVWLLASRPLDCDQRKTVNLALARRIGADPGAVTEPRWGRCPGFRSGKSGRPWTNLLANTALEGSRFDPGPHLSPLSSPERGGRVPLSSATLSDRSDGSDESAREFAYAIHALRAGTASERVVERVAAHALQRGKRRTLEACRLYAERTVRAAKQRLG